MNDNFFQQKYKILKVLEYGAFSTVHLAINQENNEKCTIKEISIKKNDLPKKLEIFEREAKVLSNIKHAHIPEFFEIFKIEEEKETKIFLVQEYIEGNSLANLIKEHHFFNEEEVLEIALDLAEVLEYLHSFSPPIIHRDIKPENIIYSNNRKVYLIDFGAVIDDILYEKMEFQGLSTIIGTQSYMPLEQLRGHAVKASDIYSLGLTLIFLLSHKVPYQFESKGLNLNFLPHVNISKNFYKLLKKMIEPDWEKRYQSASELKQDILKVLNKVYKNNLNSPYDSNSNKFSGVNLEKIQELIPYQLFNLHKDSEIKVNTDLVNSENTDIKNSGSGLEILESLNNINEVLKKIALQGNLSKREQELLIALTINKISDEQNKYEILSGLIKNKYLSNEIIKTLIINICNSFTNDILIRKLLTKLISTHDLSTFEQNFLITNVFNYINTEDILFAILSSLIEYRFLKDEVLATLIEKISKGFKTDVNKRELLKKIIEKHSLSSGEQKLFIEMVLDNFSSEEIKVFLIKFFIDKQYLNKNINLYITEQINKKFASEKNKQTILNIIMQL